MQFLIQDVADRRQPEEAELKEFFYKNREQFQSPVRISFSHVYFTQDHRGQAALKKVEDVFKKLQTDNPQRAPELGDPFMLNYDYVKISQPKTAGLFGNAFADQLFKLRPGSWHGPIRSGYGIHFVRLLDFIPVRNPDYSEVAEHVRREYVSLQRKKANTEAIKVLKDRYKIGVETNTGVDK